jgi:SRSO17 transposase
MDVELQILKHLARNAQPTVSFIDEYCSGYKDLFPEVRSYECFKYLHLGIISPLKRKSLPEIALISRDKLSPIATSFSGDLARVNHRD